MNAAQRTSPALDMAAGIYADGTYLENNRGWHVQDSPWKATQIQMLLERNALRPATLCEVGCGAGEILSRLSEAFPACRFHGYEVSAQAFALCRQRSSERLSFKLADLLEDDVPPFDVLMAIDVFEHVEDYLGFLRRLKSKGRYKVFHIPLDLSVQSVLRAAPLGKVRRSVGHLHYFTKETALATLEHAGYEIVDHFYTATAIDLPNRGWKANLMKLPRRMLYRLNPDWAARLFGGYSLMVLAR
jgi:hypothetical protein